MEDVLDVYEQAFDPAHPVVCFNEKSVVLYDLLAIHRWGCTGQAPAPLSQKLNELTTRPPARS